MLGDIIQPTHLLLILVVALLVLGPKRLPEVGRSLGRGLMSFRQGIQGVQDEARGVFHDALEEPSQPPENSTPTATEQLAPAATAPVVTPEPAAATVAKAAPAEPDPVEYTD